VARPEQAAPKRAASSNNRTPPALSRPRRIAVDDDDLVQTPPSSLDLDRSASAARSGRLEMEERLEEHTETDPSITGGDVDANWESAYSVGDEAPGGDSPTPDQDVVEAPDAGDPVAHLEHRPDALHLEPGLVPFELLLEYRADFLGLERHALSPAVDPRLKELTADPP
jgi:hypothetical protein